MKRFVMNCNDYYWDMDNDKIYNLPKGTEVIFVEKVDGDIRGTVDSGEAKGLTIFFATEELDEIKDCVCSAEDGIICDNCKNKEV